MLIISKYLIREIFKYVGIVLAMVVGIYVAVDFFEKIDNFIEAGVPFSKAIVFLYSRFLLSLRRYFRCVCCWLFLLFLA